MRLFFTPFVALLVALTVSCGGDDDEPVPFTPTADPAASTATAVSEQPTTAPAPTITPEATGSSRRH